MIAKSDLIILVVSASALGLGIYRWQQNTAAPDLAAVPADTRTVADEPLGVLPDNADDDSVAASDDAARNDGAVTVRRLPSTGPERGTDPGSASASGNERVPSVDDDSVTPPEPRVVDAPEALVTASSESDESDGTLYGRYRVQEGDYLGLIAERFGTSIANLRSINGIEGNLILIGQELRYPLPAN